MLPILYYIDILIFNMLKLITFVEVEKDDKTKQTVLQQQNFVDFIFEQCNVSKIFLAHLQTKDRYTKHKVNLRLSQP
jgi:hypothetical protein